MKYLIKIRHLYWKYFGQPDFPPQDFPISFDTSPRGDKVIFPNYLRYTLYFRAGFSVEEISSKVNVTRERVRQCMWKAYWRHHTGYGDELIKASASAVLEKHRDAFKRLKESGD